jgi:ABC-type glycerol-3-phosphate transport system permease component
MTTSPRSAATDSVSRKPSALPRGQRVRHFGGRLALVLALLLVSAATLLPLLYALAASFKPLSEALTDGARLLPKTWRFANFSDAWSGAEFARSSLNSVIVTGPAVIFGVLAASMCGYVFARRLVWGQSVWQAAMAAAIFLGAGTPTLWPRFLIARRLHLVNLTGIVIVELAEIMVLTTFLVRGFCKNMGVEVEEAARLDGCGLVRTYWHIALPMMRPILTTITVLTFQWSWNSFQTPLVFTLTRPNLHTLTVAVYALKTVNGNALGEYSVLMAGAILALVPIVVVYVIGQRYFMSGFSDGATKG